MLQPEESSFPPERQWIMLSPSANTAVAAAAESNRVPFYRKIATIKSVFIKFPKGIIAPFILYVNRRRLFSEELQNGRRQKIKNGNIP